MRQIEYQGSARSVPFAPVRAADKTGQELDQLNQRMRWMRENNQMRQADEARLAESRADNLEALAKFSSTLGDSLLQYKKVRDERDEAEGLNQAYMDGLPPEVMNGFTSEMAALNQADETLQQVGDEAAKRGAPFEVVNQFRNLSGKKAVGYAKGMAQMAAMSYGRWMSEALEKDDKTEIRVGDEVFTPATAEGTVRKQAAMAVLRSKYFQITGMSGMNAALLNQYAWPTMKDADAKILESYSEGFRKRVQGEAKDSALNEFTMGVGDDPSLFGSTVLALMRNGEEPREARKQVMSLLLNLQASGKISPEQVMAVKDSLSFDGSTSNGKKFAQDWIDVEMAMRRNEREAYQLEQAEEDRMKDNWSDNVVQELEKGTYDAAVVDDFISKSRALYDGWVDQRLLDYKQNRSLQARSKQEQRSALESMVQMNSLSVKELTSGKYRFELRREFMAEATKQDQLRAPQVQDAKKFTTQTLARALRTKLGAVSAGEEVHWSYEFALADAQRRADVAAATYIAAGKSPQEAYQLAARDLAKEIEAAQPNSSSPFALNQQLGKGAGFAAYTNGPSSVGTAQALSRSMEQIGTQIRSGGAAVIQQQKLLGKFLSQEEIAKLTNPAVPPPPIVGMMASWTNGKMSEFDVINAQLKQYGMPERQLPAMQQWADTTLTPELRRLLNVTPTAARTSRAYYGAGGPPQSIRTGQAGFQDVMQAAAAAGHPNPAVAAAQWALESGYGKFKSGRNNVFGQKGAGSSVSTQEFMGGRMVGVVDSFVDYNSVMDSVQDHVKKWGKFANSPIPRQAIQGIQAAGYATDPQYVTKIAKILRDNGINPDAPFQMQPAVPGGSVWRNPGLMSAPARKLLTQWQMTSGFGAQESFRRKPHGGKDFGTPENRKLSLRQPGVVVDVGDPNQNNGGYGGFVDVKLQDGRVVRLAHLNKVKVKPGQKLGAKQVFALSGNTGRSTGAHVHIEDITGGTKRNPMQVASQIYADD